MDVTDNGDCLAGAVQLSAARKVGRLVDRVDVRLKLRHVPSASITGSRSGGRRTAAPRDRRRAAVKTTWMRLRFKKLTERHDSFGGQRQQLKFLLATGRSCSPGLCSAARSPSSRTEGGFLGSQRRNTRPGSRRAGLSRFSAHNIPKPWSTSRRVCPTDSRTPAVPPAAALDGPGTSSIVGCLLLSPRARNGMLLDGSPRRDGAAWKPIALMLRPQPKLPLEQAVFKASSSAPSAAGARESPDLW